MKLEGRNADEWPTIGAADAANYLNWRKPRVKFSIRVEGAEAVCQWAQTVSDILSPRPFDDIDRKFYLDTIGGE